MELFKNLRKKRKKRARVPDAPPTRDAAEPTLVADPGPAPARET